MAAARAAHRVDRRCAGGSGARRAPLLAAADIVHVHSNGLLPEVSARLARRLGKPVVLTLYGTEIWHYRRKLGADLFTSAYRHADAVTFYSQRLLDRAQRARARPSAAARVDLPAGRRVVPLSRRRRRMHAGAPRARDLTAANVLVNVKRLHPLAGQRYLLEAMAGDRARSIPTRISSSAAPARLLPELQAVARSVGSGAARHVRRPRRQRARRALLRGGGSLRAAVPARGAADRGGRGAGVRHAASISSDNPGGVELHGVFGDDVAVVPREQPRRSRRRSSRRWRRSAGRRRRRTTSDRRRSSAPTRWRASTGTCTRR